jgi:hypothetical protein
VLAAIGGVAAAVASFRAARVALEIARQEAKRQEDRFERRAKVHAAYIFNQLVVAAKFAEQVQPIANGIVGATDFKVVQNLASELESQARAWQVAVDAIRPENIAELPDSCAAPTAGAISQSRFTILLAISIFDTATRHPDRSDQVQKNAAAVERQCILIAQGFLPYSTYVQEHFDVHV